MFFDERPRFFETSQTTPARGRLNLRYEAIFAENVDVFADARVLDIASHDGRWSYAALMTGAAHVVGVEARESLVRNARDNLRHYGVADDRYEFMLGDVFEVMSQATLQVDVVLCLGFMYHTLRYNELLRYIRDSGAQHLIIDTSIARTNRPMIHVRVEETGREGNAVADRLSPPHAVLSGQPSLRALQRMLTVYGYEIERLSDWGGLLRDNPGCQGVGVYRNGDRITARCRRMA